MSIPKHPGAIHRFFDTSPISPDGRYLAACILPRGDRLPLPRERAGILLVDLETGAEEVIAETEGWAIQVGANLQWGDNRTLYYNDLYPDAWAPCLVGLDIFTGEKRRMKNGVFMLSPDGRYALTHNLAKSRLTQNGYEVMIPDEMIIRNDHHPKDDGFQRFQAGSSSCLEPGLEICGV